MAVQPQHVHGDVLDGVGQCKITRRRERSPAARPNPPAAICDSVAQLAEHVTFNHRVPGSSPGRVTNLRS
jgi:hypothetical protein